MLVIPAIDIKDGCVVRLVQGNPADKTVYSKDPLKTAKHWVRQGAGLIHVVDLDGALTGIAKNLETVKQILKNAAVPVQCGGGIRKIETIKMLLDSGAYRVVLGTKAIEDRNFLKAAFKKFGAKVIVSIDARDNRVLIKGWQGAAYVGALALAKDLKESGFRELIYTDTSKDGTLKGPNIKAVKALLKETGMKIIASGGIAALEDVRKFKMLEKKGVTGIIVGKALYEGKFTLQQALKLS